MRISIFPAILLRLSGRLSVLCLLLLALLGITSLPPFARSATASQPPSRNAASFGTELMPHTMVAGFSYPITVDFQNTGTTTWAPGSAYHLGALDPQDNSTWGMDRVFLPAYSDPIKPGQSVSFNFIVTAPSKPGIYHFQWRMVQDEVAWFGDPTNNDSILVLPKPTPPPGLLTQRWFLDQPMVTTHVQFINLPSGDVVLSPHGRRIAYLTSLTSGPGSPAVIRIRTIKGIADDLVSNAFTQAFVSDFSPNGQNLLVNGLTHAEMNGLTDVAGQPNSSTPFGWTLWRVVISTGAITPLMPLSVDCDNAQYSPSGKEILFHVNGNSDQSLPLQSRRTHRYLHSIANGTYMIDSDGRHLHWLHWLHRNDVPQWAPNGKQITVLRRARKGAPAEIWFMSRSGKLIRPLQLKNTVRERKPISDFNIFWYSWLGRKTLLVDGIASPSKGQPNLGQLWIVHSDGVMEQKVPPGETVVGMAQGAHELLVSDDAYLWLISLAPAQP
jgi:hypothetical protein